MGEGCTTKGDVQSACPYCGVGCGVTVNKGVIRGDNSHPANRGALCVKGSALAESLAMPSRLLYPKVGEQEVTWGEATEVISEKMARCIREHGPDSVALYVSGQLLTEDYYVANKLMKGWVGSANIDTNSRLCMSSAVAAHVRAFGEDLVPVGYDDLAQTDLLVITGANTAWTHPILFRRIQQAREANPDLRLVVIDPRETVTAQQADLHLPVARDGDVLLYGTLMRYCLDTGQLDTDYIEQHTNGWQALVQELRDRKYHIEQASQTLGIDSVLLKTFCHWFASNPKAISLFCQGYNQSTTGTDKGNALINAHLITGKIGKPGCGPFSMTGQPNAMGGREVGGLANQLAVHRGFDSESVEQVRSYWRAPNMASTPGLKAVDMFDAIEQGKIRFVWIISTNPVVSMPDADRVQKALQQCECVVVSDITAQTDTAACADILLPATGWGEKEGMVTNSERMISRQRAFMPPPGEALADWQALAQVGSKLSRKLGVEDGFAFSSAREVFCEYTGLTGINRDSRFKLELSALRDLSEQEYQTWQPVRWPLQQDESMFADGLYATPDGRANLVVTPVAQAPVVTDWWLNTGRSRDQWHTMTRTGHIAHLGATESEPTVYMNTLSSQHAGVQAGELASLSASGGECLARVAIDDGLSYKQLYMSMHWAGRYSGRSRVNRLVSAATDPYSGQPAFKSSRVDVTPAGIQSYGLYLGTAFSGSDWDYASYQQGDGYQIWRFAQREPLHKRQRMQPAACRRLLLDHEAGWVAVDLSEWQQIEGIQIVSSRPVRLSPDKLGQLLGRELALGQLLNLLSAGEGDGDKLVCSCFRVSESQIRHAIEEQGLVSLSQLQAELKCGSNCGSCLPEVRGVINQFSAPVSVTPEPVKE